MAFIWKIIMTIIIHHCSYFSLLAFHYFAFLSIEYSCGENSKGNKKKESIMDYGESLHWNIQKNWSHSCIVFFLLVFSSSPSQAAGILPRNSCQPGNSDWPINTKQKHTTEKKQVKNTRVNLQKMHQLDTVVLLSSEKKSDKENWHAAGTVRNSPYPLFPFWNSQPPLKKLP